jgi:hypothetical protein
VATTDWYLTAAASAADLVGQPAVADQWPAPSALAGLSVGALAEHLAGQLFLVESALDAGPCPTAPLSLLEHYATASWVTAGPDDQPNVVVRETATESATEGPAALAERARAAARSLAGRLPEVPPDRVVQLTWQPWALRLEDLLITRLMEIAVHGDDLACSVGLTTPELPAGATDLVVTLLSRLAVRRHGPAAVIRALSRAERAPATIAAF